MADNRTELRNKIQNIVKEFCEIQYKKQKFIPGQSIIPPAGKLLDYKEISYMIDASLDGWLTTGRFNDKFEKQLSNFLGIKHVITVNSGSSANLVAFNTLTSPKLGKKAIKKGDEVISVACGFPTTVNPIIQFGAVPVFIDVDLSTHNINVDLIENAITSKTKAIMIAHTLGNPFNVIKIREICDKYKLWLVEDCCDALGAEFNNQKVGSFGDISTLSFYPAHHITMGEGGAVMTNSIRLKVIAESFRDWGRDCFCKTGCDNTCNRRFDQKQGQLPEGYDHKYIYSHIGYNLKITDIQAACGLAQLEKLDFFIKKRRTNFHYLYEKFNSSSLNKYFHLPEKTENSNPSWFGFPITLKNHIDFNRKELIDFLDSKNIGTRLIFAGNIIKQPYFKNIPHKVVGELKNTDYIMNNTFWVGIHPSLDFEQLDYIHKSMLDFIELK